MKKTFLLILFTIMLSLWGGVNLAYEKNAYALESDVTILNDTDYQLSDNYLDFYSISSDLFTAENNGGNMSTSSVLANAFDRNTSSYFESSSGNNNNFTNYIDVTFSISVEVDRILYGGEPNTTRGYPVKLNIYALTNDELTLIKTFDSTATTNMVCFRLDETISTTQIRLEYAKVPTNHRYTATAREIMFLQPEDTQNYNNYLSLFSDYSETKVNENYATLEKLNEFKQTFANNVNFESVIKQKFDRAENILSDELVFDAKREFSTSHNATNKINQYGNIITQARTVLKMNSFGTNRQVTGIAVKSNEQICIYVDANENDPLPKIRFLQVIGYWNSFISSEYQLKLGKNLITVPYFINSNYNDPVVAGASIYIINPYTQSEQSENVKIYFDDGDFFPVYRLGDDETKFKQQLSEYAEKLKNDSENTFDIVEIVTNHVILTLTAKNCNEYYINQSYSPKTTAENWEAYMKKLLTFGGVEFDKTAKNYSTLNEYLNVNFRVSQIWKGAGAYAYTEHIGVYKSWEGTAISAKNFGWATSHELGHMMDIPGRTIGETTNNMWAKFNETAIEQLASRDYAEYTTNGLMSDNATYDNGFFNTNRYNYQIWWNIECYQKGFWGNLENCYRGMNENYIKLTQNKEILTKINSLSSTERHVLFSSIASGIDLSYYFERWGFNMSTSDTIFNYENSSQNYKDCLAKAIELNIVDNTIKPKLWYQDKKAYLIEKSNISYSNSSEISIKNVFKTDNGYSILMNVTTNSNHLGFEILEGNDIDGYKVIGFTFGTSFTDTTTYDATYTPSYKIIAYDRNYNYSKESLAITTELNTENVCRIGDTYYTSLNDAINAASDGETIIIIASCYLNNVTISKNLIITIESENIKIYRTETGNLFTINNGYTLTLTGLENNYLTISGYNVSQNGSLIYSLGTLKATYVNFTENISSGYGAVYALNGGTVTLLNCNIFSNKGVNGGAISATMERGTKSTTFNLTNVKIYNNTATYGAVAYSNGTLNFTNCEIYSNITSSNGTICNINGGIVRLNTCIVKNNTALNGGALYLDGYTEIKNSTIESNSALNFGGAIYYSTSASNRTVTSTNSNFSNNNAKEGKTIYLNSGNLNLISTTIVSNLIANNSSLINADLFINSGTCTINSNCDITSIFTINNGANLVLKTGLFTNFENCLYQVQSNTTSATLLSSSGFDLTQEDMDKIKMNETLFVKTLKNNQVIITINEIIDDKDDDEPNDEQPSNQNSMLIIVIICVALCCAFCVFLTIRAKKKKSKAVKHVILDNHTNKE